MPPDVARLLAPHVERTPEGRFGLLDRRTQQVVDGVQFQPNGHRASVHARQIQEVAHIPIQPVRLLLDGVVSPRDYITAVLKAEGGNRTKAAAALGIGAATLYRKLKSYGLAPAADQLP